MDDKTRETVKQFVKTTFDISDEAFVESMTRGAELVVLKKGGILIKEGEPQTKLYFLLDGGVRGYMLNESGKEVTDCFMFTPGAPLMSIRIFEPSCVTFVAYKPSRVIAFPLEETMASIEANSQAHVRYEKVLAMAAMTHASIKAHLYGSAAQRYKWFLSEYPMLIGEVSDRSIASFLGITPVSLSRLHHDPEIKQLEADVYANKTCKYV